MEGIYTFVSSDPTFMLVHNGFIPELKSLGHLQVNGCKTVQTASFLKGNDEDEYKFGKWYDFARTAQPVLRMFMLEASGMREHFDPVFKQPGKSRNFESIHSQLAPDEPFDMAHGVPERAVRIAAEFDRLYPHYIIQHKVKDMQRGKTRSLPGSMYVIYFNEGLFYHIVTAMDITYRSIYNTRPQAMKIEAKLHVAVIKCSFDVPQNLNQLPRYQLLRDLINEFNDASNFQQLDFADIEDDDVEQAVADYFS